MVLFSNEKLCNDSGMMFPSIDERYVNPQFVF